MTEKEGIRRLFVYSALKLVEEGCLVITTPGGEELSADALQAIIDEHGDLPGDFVMRITARGRAALERGRP